MLKEQSNTGYSSGLPAIHMESVEKDCYKPNVVLGGRSLPVDESESILTRQHVVGFANQELQPQDYSTTRCRMCHITSNYYLTADPTPLTVTDRDASVDSPS